MKTMVQVQMVLIHVQQYFIMFTFYVFFRGLFDYSMLTNIGGLALGLMKGVGVTSLVAGVLLALVVNTRKLHANFKVIFLAFFTTVAIFELFFVK
jgi:hypothetical protein